jgi:hypothetical protein
MVNFTVKEALLLPVIPNCPMPLTMTIRNQYSATVSLFEMKNYPRKN